jgi:hypothetical protein
MSHSIRHVRSLRRGLLPALGLLAAIVVGSAVLPAANATEVGPLAAGDTISGWKNSFHLVGGANVPIEVGRINVPAGAYAISAKLYVQSAANDHVSCTLTAGQDFDTTVIDHDAPVAFNGIPLQVVHGFNTSFPIVLTCTHLLAFGDAFVSFVKITAQQTASLINIQMQ